MPMKSQQQRRLMYAVASGSAKGTGVTRKVAKDFVAHDKPGKLPRYVKNTKNTKGKGAR
jgi:hypothetical protein